MHDWWCTRTQCLLFIQQVAYIFRQPTSTTNKSTKSGLRALIRLLGATMDLRQIYTGLSQTTPVARSTMGRGIQNSGLMR